MLAWSGPASAEAPDSEVTSLSAPSSAESFTVGRVQVEGGLNYGLYLGDTAVDIPTPYGVGVHARAGYTLEPGVYLGAESNYFFGATQRFPELGDVEGSLSVFQLGAEVGYDVPLGSALVVRPKVGAGAATVTIEVDVEGVKGHIRETGLALAAGGQILLGWDPVFLTAEARYTRLSINTEKLQETPGIEVQDQQQLDGLLFSAGIGLVF